MLRQILSVRNAGILRQFGGDNSPYISERSNLKHLARSIALGLFFAASFLSTAHAEELGTECGSGFICQGAGCDLYCDSVNPSDTLSLSFPDSSSTVSTVNIVITRNPNPATDGSTIAQETGQCQLSFNEQGNVGNGKFTAGLTAIPTDSGLTPALGVDGSEQGETETVVYSYYGSGANVSLKVTAVVE